MWLRGRDKKYLWWRFSSRRNWPNCLHCILHASEQIFSVHELIRILNLFHYWKIKFIPVKVWIIKIIIAAWIVSVSEKCFPTKFVLLRTYSVVKCTNKDRCIIACIRNVLVVRAENDKRDLSTGEVRIININIFLFEFLRWEVIICIIYILTNVLIFVVITFRPLCL